MFLRQSRKSHLVFYAFVGLFLGLFVLVESINQKLWTNDFRVYYGAVQDFFDGNNPYTTNYGLDTGYFKYPPFTLYLFGILKLLPYWLAQVIHLSLSAVALMISLPLLTTVAERYSFNKQKTWLLYAGFFSIAIHLARELHMGNINLILLGLFSAGLYFIDRKSAVTIICWSLMIILKPIMILTVVPLLFFGKWRLVGYISLAGLCFFLFPAIHLGWNGNLDIWNDWYISISEHGNYIISYNSLRFLAFHYVGITSEWGPSLTVLFVLLLLLFLSIRNRRQDQLINWIVVFVAFIPNFFVTDTQHFLISVPLIVFLMHELAIRKSIVAWLIFSVAFGLFSLNSNDLLGRNLSDFMYDNGMLGIGNLIFIGLYIFAFTSNEKKHLSTDVTP